MYFVLLFPWESPGMGQSQVVGKHPVGNAAVGNWKKLCEENFS